MQRRGIALSWPVQYCRHVREQKEALRVPLYRTFATETGPKKSDEDPESFAADVAVIIMLIGGGLFVLNQWKKDDRTMHTRWLKRRYEQPVNASKDRH